MGVRLHTDEGQKESRWRCWPDLHCLSVNPIDEYFGVEWLEKGHLSAHWAIFHVYIPHKPDYA